MKKLRIFCAIANWNWEQPNFIQPLKDMGHEVIWYDWKAKGYDQYSQDWESSKKKQMNDELLEGVKANHKGEPLDLFFSYLSDPVIEENYITEIKSLKIPTLNFSCNDIFTFDRGHKNTAPCFDLNWTVHKAAVANYEAVNANVICVPHGINTDAYNTPFYLYQPNRKYKFDVSFVGQPYGYRLPLFCHLTDPQFKLTYGLFGKISFNLMLETFLRTKVNIGFSGVPGGNFFEKKEKQLRFRDFEVPAVGGLYLTERTDFIQELYEENKEILLYNTKEEMIEKAVFYSQEKNAMARNEIAFAGHERCLSEYNCEKIFDQIFKKMDLI